MFKKNFLSYISKKKKIIGNFLVILCLNKMIRILYRIKGSNTVLYWIYSIKGTV